MSEIYLLHKDGKGVGGVLRRVYWRPLGVLLISFSNALKAPKSLFGRVPVDFESGYPHKDYLPKKKFIVNCLEHCRFCL